jgi:hypothetical protein
VRPCRHRSNAIRINELADDEDEPIPPTPARVAARAMVLSAVACRGAIEKDADKPGAEMLRKQILPWLERIGASDELEPRESSLIATPLGILDKKTEINGHGSQKALLFSPGLSIMRISRPSTHSVTQPTPPMRWGFLATARTLPSTIRFCAMKTKSDCGQIPI